MGLAGCAWLLISSTALAFPVEVQVIGKVSQGKRPLLILTAHELSKRSVITLKRDDGRVFKYSLGDMGAGTRKEVLLDGQVGHHTYEGTMNAQVNEESITSPLAFSTVVAAPLRISVDRASVNLDARSLELTTSRPVESLTLKIVGVGGAILAEETHALVAKKKGPTTIHWAPVEKSDIVRLEIRVEDQDGFFSAIALTPWSLNIRHEEVHFASGSPSIDTSEVPKLESSLAEIKRTLERFQEIKGVQLFIAGHTDSVGSVASNKKLSRRRAQAIAAWFVGQKLPLRVSFEGFGETSPKIKTADEVPEQKNRRVDYILSVEPPLLKNAGHAWRRLN